MSILQNITNTEIANLSNCEVEPIHIPGTIQPHGVLLAVDDQLIVRYSSANTAVFFNKPFEALLGNTIENICGAEAFQKFKEYIAEGRFDDVSPFVFDINDIMFNTTVHLSGDLLLIDLNPSPMVVCPSVSYTIKRAALPPVLKKRRACNSCWKIQLLRSAGLLATIG